MRTAAQPKPRSRFLYMAVTNDELELPVFFANSSKELAKAAGVAASTVLTYVCRAKNIERYREKDICNWQSKMKLKYIKVELPEDDDQDLMADAPMQAIIH